MHPYIFLVSYSTMTELKQHSPPIQVSIIDDLIRTRDFYSHCQSHHLLSVVDEAVSP